MKAVIQEMPTKWLDERRASDASRYDEMWDGVLHMAPAPDMDHQDLAVELVFLLKSRWEPLSRGKLFYEVNVTTPEDEARWINNYRIPDIVMLSPDRLRFRKKKYTVGPPLVCVEFHSPGDDAYEKLPFYAKLGVPEVWIIHGDSKEPEFHQLDGGEYRIAETDRGGWVHSRVVGLAMKAVDEKLHVLFDGDAEPEIIPK